MNKELMKFNHWMKINKLLLNYIKTKFMIISNKKHTDRCEIKLGEHIIEQVKQIKYLRVILDDRLSWKPHIQHVCSKVSTNSWALLKLRNYVGINTLKTVYYSHIYSQPQYCITSWGMASTNALDHWKNCTSALCES